MTVTLNAFAPVEPSGLTKFRPAAPPHTFSLSRWGDAGEVERIKIMITTTYGSGVFHLTPIADRPRVHTLDCTLSIPCRTVATDWLRLVDEFADPGPPENAMICRLMAPDGGTGSSGDNGAWSNAASVTDPIIAELEELAELPEGWDGENAAAPSRHAINDAASFVRLAGQLAGRLEPTLHVDGSVILEIGDGSDGSLRFKGDGKVIYAFRGRLRGSVVFNRKTIPGPILAALSALT